MTLLMNSVDQLTYAQQQLVAQLHAQTGYNRYNYEVQNSYYEGVARIASLGISIPPTMNRLKTVIGWPRVIVDSLDERLDVEGFRLSDGVDADDDLWGIWQANNLDEESQLAHLDALTLGASYVCVGSGDKPGDQPIITVESALDMACVWDARTRTIQAAFRSYVMGDFGINPLTLVGTLYLPDSTISVVMPEGGGQWIVVDRDDHMLGKVPVVRLTNRARITDRNGRSEITPEIISITDAACRTLLGLEVAREFYAAPQRYMLGVSEKAFQGADGKAKNAWETYMGRILALEADANGNMPQVGQFQTYSPEAFTKVLDEYAQILTSMTGLPAEYLGITTSIPSSADAIRMNSDRLINKVRRKQRSFEGGWEEVMRLALLIRDHVIPTDALSMETLWRNPAIPTPAATADAIMKEVQIGAVPATSDVVLERLGYSALERRRLEIDREKDKAAQIEAELSQALIAKEARVNSTIQADIVSADTVQGTPPGATVKGGPVTPPLVAPRGGK